MFRHREILWDVINGGWPDLNALCSVCSPWGICLLSWKMNSVDVVLLPRVSTHMGLQGSVSNATWWKPQDGRGFGHRWEVFPIWEVFSCMGSAPMIGKSGNIWEDSPYMRRLPIWGKSPHNWEDYPYMGRPYMASIRVCQNPLEILEIGVASYSGSVWGILLPTSTSNISGSSNPRHWCAYGHPKTSPKARIGSKSDCQNLNPCSDKPGCYPCTNGRMKQGRVDSHVGGYTPQYMERCLFKVF